MPYNVRMAYPTGANLNALLLQQLNFRTAGNYPISSLYTLYANGQGQTYWSNSLIPPTLSILSTSIGNALQSTNNKVNILSTQVYTLSGEVSTLTHYTYSSFSTTFYYLDTCLNISTNLNDAFLSTANSFQIQLNSYYQSTLDACYSTVNSLATVSTFNSDLNILNSSVQLWLSTMSTGIGLQDALTSSLLIQYINYNIYSTMAWTTQQLSSITSTSATKQELANFSTSINTALLSTSAGLSGEITDTYNFIEDVSTSIIVVNNALLSTSINLQTSIADISGAIVNISSSIGTLSGELSSFKHYTSSAINSLSGEVSSIYFITAQNTANISSLNQQVSIITTSSILEGIYASFIELEQYTVNLINSTNTAYVYYLSTALSTQTAIIDHIVTSSVYGAVSTLTYVVSTALYTLSGEISTALYSLSGEISTALYSLSGEISTIAANATAAVSSVNAVQLIQLNSSNFTGLLDLVNYRNFTIQVNNIADLANSTYRISFNPTTLSNATLQQGVILLDISTNTQGYTQNNNLLALDLNRWGIINNATYSQFPMLADSAYKMEYIYSVYNSNVYTSLTNIWPYQNTFNLNVSSINDNTVLDPSGVNIYSTGTVLDLTWQMYLFSTFVTGFSSFVNVDVDISGALIQTYGPYFYTQSSIQIAMPDGGYPSGTGYVSATFVSYVVGEPAQGSVVYGAAYYP